jgi:hypothetical protein
VPVAKDHLFATYFPTPDVNSNYHAMNARLQRRFANGFQFDAVYRWSKSLDQLSYEGPGAPTNQTYPLDNQTEWGASDFDVRHNWTISGIWDLPFFRDRNDWVEVLLGGWQISGIWTRHTGFPWTPKVDAQLRSESGEFYGPVRPMPISVRLLTELEQQLPSGGRNFSNRRTVGPDTRNMPVPKQLFHSERASGSEHSGDVSVPDLFQAILRTC